MSEGYMPQAKTTEWSTPQDFFNELNDEFHFNLDVASSDENAKCENYFTIDDDGLSNNWGGYRVWCNPPYGKEMPRWIEKAYNERNNAECIVMLIPSRTDTKAFHNYIYGIAEIRFVKGRLKFGGMKQSAPFASMVVIYRPQTDWSRKMSKEWKCKDCVVFGTDACHYPSMEAHYIACEHLVVDHDEAYQQGRADVLREHREQCQGKCFKCEVSVPFVSSDGEEVILPYSYSYKADCEDNRYINAKEVLSLIEQARADAIDDVKRWFNSEFERQNASNSKIVPSCVIKENVYNVLEQLKENKN